MIRYLLALSALVALAGSAGAKEVSIKWHGQSFFEIKTSAGTVIAIDPHDLEAYGKRQVKADLVLVTHFHIDHCNFAQITNERAKVIYGLKNKDRLAGSRKSDEFANVDETFKDVKIKGLGSYHDDVEGMKRGKNTIFILEFDGLRIVFLGDLGHELTPSLAKKVGIGKDQDEKLIKRFKHNELTLDPESVPRKKALIAMLGYEEK